MSYSGSMQVSGICGLGSIPSIPTNMEITIDWLRKLSNKPRLHPNGFIQLDIADGVRLHVWPQENLAKISVQVPIHDHVYGFDSFIMCGQMGNTIYDIEIDPNGEYNLYQTTSYAAVKKELPLEQVNNYRYALKTIKEFWTSAGEIYHMNPFIFHESHTRELTATVIRITSFDKTKPVRVLCPIGVKPDNSFKRDSVDQTILWGYIEKALKISPYKNLPEGWLSI